MRRREFIALSGASVAWPFAALAQEPGRTYRLGCLFPRSRAIPRNIAFFDELRRRGFIEGQNLTIEYRAFGATRRSDPAICSRASQGTGRCHRSCRG